MFRIRHLSVLVPLVTLVGCGQDQQIGKHLGKTPDGTANSEMSQDSNANELWWNDKKYLGLSSEIKTSGKKPAETAKEILIKKGSLIVSLDKSLEVSAKCLLIEDTKAKLLSKEIKGFIEVELAKACTNGYYRNSDKVATISNGFIQAESPKSEAQEPQAPLKDNFDYSSVTLLKSGTTIAILEPSGTAKSKCVLNADTKAKYTGVKAFGMGEFQLQSPCKDITKGYVSSLAFEVSAQDSSQGFNPADFNASSKLKYVVVRDTKVINRDDPAAKTSCVLKANTIYVGEIYKSGLGLPPFERPIFLKGLPKECGEIGVADSRDFKAL